jgi:hypothetical protein
MTKMNVIINNKNLSSFKSNLNIEAKKNVFKSKINIKECKIIDFNKQLNPIIIIENKIGLWHLKWCGKTRLWYEIYSDSSLSLTGYKIQYLNKKFIKKNSKKNVKENLKKKLHDINLNNIEICNFKDLKINSFLIICDTKKKIKPKCFKISELYRDDSNLDYLIKGFCNNITLHLLYDIENNFWIELVNYQRTKNTYNLNFLNSKLDSLIYIIESEI